MRIGLVILEIAALCGLFPVAAMASGLGEAGSGSRTASDAEEQVGRSLPAWLQLNAVVRGRFEVPSGSSAANADLDGFYSSRIRFGFRLKPADWLRFHVQVQDARAVGYNAPVQPTSLYDPLDVRLGYVELVTEGRVSATFTAGRQEITLGSGRLLATPEWGNTSRVYDAARVALSRDRYKLDLFAGSVVAIDSHRCDRSKSTEQLYGAYGSLPALPKAAVEPYLLVKRGVGVKGELGGPGAAISATAGARVIGALPHRLDYTVEVAVQRGSYSADRISAFAGTYLTGWVLNGSKRKPRISVEFNHASGDHGAKDGLRGTFDQLYASNHTLYGIADQVGWRNLRNPRAGFDFAATRRLKVRADYNEFFLATVQDGLYNAAGTRTVLNTRATSRHVGSEFDVQVSYQHSSMLQFGAGYAYLLSGGYLEQSTRAGSYSYPYVMFTKRFL